MLRIAIENDLNSKFDMDKIYVLKYYFNDIWYPKIFAQGIR